MTEEQEMHDRIAELCGSMAEAGETYNPSLFTKSVLALRELIEENYELKKQ